MHFWLATVLCAVPMEVGNGVEAQACVCAANETAFGGFFKNDLSVLAEEADEEGCLFFAAKLALAEISSICSHIFLIGNNFCHISFACTCGKSLAAQALYRCTSCQHHILLALNVGGVDVRHKQIGRVYHICANVAVKGVTVATVGIPPAVENAVSRDGRIKESLVRKCLHFVVLPTPSSIAPQDADAVGENITRLL